MKKTILFLSMFIFMTTGLLFGQNDYFNMMLNLKDSEFVSFESKASNYAPYGGTFTPKGTLKVLVIYAGLYPWSFS